MSGVNKVIIIGHLGADPEHRTFDNGGSVTNISVATSEKWTDKATGEPKEQTEWHRISLFNRLAEIAVQYLRKGSQVYIEGSLRTRKYQDQQTGEDKYITEIRASSMQMLGGNNNQQQNNNYQAQQPQQQTQPQPQYGQHRGGNAQITNQVAQQTTSNTNTNNTIPTSNGVDDDIPF